MLSNYLRMQVDRLHLCCLLGGEPGQETQRGCFNSLIGAMIIDKDEERGEEGNVIGCHKEFKLFARTIYRSNNAIAKTILVNFEGKVGRLLKGIQFPGFREKS